jgi:putative hydrolase of the HAD superfamily
LRPPAGGDTPRPYGGGSSGIRAVLFDAGATLLHPEPPVEQVYARELAADGARFSPSQIEEALGRAWRRIREQGGDRYGGVRGEPEFWRAFLDRVRGDLDGGTVSADAFRRLASHFRDPRSWAVYPDVRPALDCLHAAGLRLAVVSNWDSYLPELLSALDLAPSFQAVLVSAIEETGKPEPEIFRRACVRLGVAPAEALHVGDSPLEDYEGARAAGLSALLLDRAGLHEAAPDRIGSLSEVAERLDL